MCKELGADVEWCRHDVVVDKQSVIFEKPVTAPTGTGSILYRLATMNTPAQRIVLCWRTVQARGSNQLRTEEQSGYACLRSQ